MFWENVVEERTFCYVYTISAYFSTVDLVYGFYFEDKESAMKVRDILFECGEVVGTESLSYCKRVTNPNKIAIAEDELGMFPLYKSVEDFIDNNKIFKRYYGDVYKPVQHSI